MGIRFYCPHCDRRLHVKDYLAGKKGICPHCDEGIVIPQASTISKQDSVGTVDPGASQAEPQSELGADDLPSSATEVSAAPAGEVRADAQFGSVRHGTGADEGAADELDPIAAGPHLIWYVRPPSGGQYGPAEGDVMRQWVQEGRVTADSLVWQEGWDEWRSAIEIFPQISPLPSENADAAPVSANSAVTPTVAQNSQGLQEDYEPVAVDESKMKMLEYRLNRSRGKGKEIALVAVLTLVCLILIAVLGLVITKQF
jgi:hypothetical protein